MALGRLFQFKTSFLSPELSSTSSLVILSPPHFSLFSQNSNCLKVGVFVLIASLLLFPSEFSIGFALCSGIFLITHFYLYSYF